MKNFIIAVIILLGITSCCKQEQDLPVDLIIDTWQLGQLDRYGVLQYKDIYYTFNVDKTGFVEYNDCEIKNFSWSIHYTDMLEIDLGVYTRIGFADTLMYWTDPEYERLVFIRR